MFHSRQIINNSIHGTVIWLGLTCDSSGEFHTLYIDENGHLVYDLNGDNSHFEFYDSMGNIISDSAPKMGLFGRLGYVPGVSERYKEFLAGYKPGLLSVPVWRWQLVENVDTGEFLIYMDSGLKRHENGRVFYVRCYDSSGQTVTYDNMAHVKSVIRIRNGDVLPVVAPDDIVKSRSRRKYAEFLTNLKSERFFT